VISLHVDYSLSLPGARIWFSPTAEPRCRCDVEKGAVFAPHPKLSLLPLARTSLTQLNLLTQLG